MKKYPAPINLYMVYLLHSIGVKYVCLIMNVIYQEKCIHLYYNIVD